MPFVEIDSEDLNELLAGVRDMVNGVCTYIKQNP